MIHTYIIIYTYTYHLNPLHSRSFPSTHVLAPARPRGYKHHAVPTSVGLRSNDASERTDDTTTTTGAGSKKWIGGIDFIRKAGFNGCEWCECDNFEEINGFQNDFHRFWAEDVWFQRISASPFCGVHLWLLENCSEFTKLKWLRSLWDAHILTSMTIVYIVHLKYIFTCIYVYTYLYIYMIEQMYVVCMYI